jgi:ADP-heptose:LPS heptosyltransferase
MTKRKFPIKEALRDTKRILLIYWAPFGDTILVTPLIKNLHDFFAGAKITYIANYPLYTPFGPPSRIIEQNPYVSECITSHKMLLADLLTKPPYDLAIDLVNNSFTGLLSYLSGARYRVWAEFRREPNSIFWAFRRPDGRWSDKVLSRIPEEKKLCRVKHLLDVSRVMGIVQSRDIQPRVYLSQKEKAFGRQALCKAAGSRRPIIAIHPGGHHKHRLWNWRNYAALCQRLVKELGAQVVVFQGPKEESVVKKVAAACKPALPVIVPKDLRQYFSLVSQSDLYISTDGGALHMALALGIRSIGIFKRPIILQYWYVPHYRKVLSPILFHPGQFRESSSSVDAVFRCAAKALRSQKRH